LWAMPTLGEHRDGKGHRHSLKMPWPSSTSASNAVIPSSPVIRITATMLQLHLLENYLQLLLL
jgi:hypothetical protein